MFFSAEVLSKRDNGFGLLWLAATLGSKSSFKKLPRRSVLSADLAQLCDNIAAPSEPLALRLSSNLMVGAARVYQVKQEFLFSDVTTCYSSLKRIIQEFHSSTPSDAQIQMAQSSVRPSAVTMSFDSSTALAMDLTNLIDDWSGYLNFGDPETNEEHSEYGTEAQIAVRSKGQPTILKPASTLLDESHEFLISSSFDGAPGARGDVYLSSSQQDDFRDDYFDALDGGDLENVFAAEIAQELGEGWAAPLSAFTSPAAVAEVHRNELPAEETAIEVEPNTVFPRDEDVPLNEEYDEGPNDMQVHEAMEVQTAFQNDAGRVPELIPSSPTGAPRLESKAQAPDSRETKSAPETVQTGRKPPKAVKLLFDFRIELTDDELKAARADYVEGQEAIRQDVMLKKLERESGQIMDNILWGAPGNAQAKELVDFWLEHFKRQTGLKFGVPSAAKRRHDDDLLLPSKRKRISEILDVSPRKRGPDNLGLDDNLPSYDDAMDTSMGQDFEVPVNFEPMDDVFPGVNLRSSEEPGQARRASRQPSDPGVGLQLPPDSLDSRSGLFPWDNAGDSPPISRAVTVSKPRSSGRMSIEQAEIRMRGSSLSRKGSPTILSQRGSVIGGISSSPAIGGLEFNDEEFQFNVPDEQDEPVFRARQSELNPVALEKNSFDFLEYARMQSLAGSSGHISFDDIVPRTTTTSHVAAAALYNCLVLGTKDHIRLQQDEAYGEITIVIK